MLADVDLKQAVDRATTSVKSGRGMEEIAGDMKTRRSDRSDKSHDADEIGGVGVTHPDRVLFPGEGVTKRDIELAMAMNAIAGQLGV